LFLAGDSTFNVSGIAALVRDCFFDKCHTYAQVQDEAPAEPDFYVVRNLFQETRGSVTVVNSWRRVVVKNNLITSSDVAGVAFGNSSGVSSIVVTGNTILADELGVQFIGEVFPKNVTLTNNVLFGVRFASKHSGGMPVPASVSNWTVGNNLYLAESDESYELPRGPTDRRGGPELFSLARNEADYLRASGDALIVEGGGFIGALPPGPVPPEGDWFTRLRERWKDVLEEK
jgi:hypothetical protein